MRAIIDCTRVVPWVSTYFPGELPYLLPIANKPYLNYLIDYCVFQKIRVIYILCSVYRRRTYLDLLGNGSRWGIRLLYVVCEEEQKNFVTTFIQSHARCLSGDSLLVLSGYFWLGYNQQQILSIALEPETFCKCSEHYFLLGEKTDYQHFNESELEEWHFSFVVIEPFDSIHAFYVKTMSIVTEQMTHYLMPNYGNMGRIYIGQNVSWDTQVQIQEPVHFGDVIQIEPDCIIGPSSVIGSHVFIDKATTISRTIVMPHSYVGAYLEIDKKIIYYNTIIDPLSGCRFPIKDELICAGLEYKKPMLESFFHRLGALILLIALALPYLLLRPLIRLRYSQDNYAFFSSKRVLFTPRIFLLTPRTFFDRWFLRFNLDRYLLLFYVLRGHLRLVGNLWIPNEAEHRDYFNRFPDYAIGLFSYSEMLGYDADVNNAATAELYYMYHASFLLNVKIFCFILLQRLLKVYS